ncbi:hypothetical protein DM02DRAFT_619845 [Periconia macrospinosa]|uniref:Uncharacterized protein n=1 Tax=Periconia macrospinosa TaxID=97972 RepID=A0A2V1D3H2_9PLEO|nr:hypothetical protein DM02DRAFT_619845 [Periconia macrospinosa]
MATNTRAKTMLSEMNLRIHTNTYPQNKPSVVPRMDRNGPPTYQTLVADLDGLSDSDESSSEECSRKLAASRKASLDALKLYSGCFDFSYTPMERFCASSPVGDVESLDASLVALEMRMITEPGCENVCPGSPRPSSDTLSVSRYQELGRERRVHVVGRSRARRRVQRSRHDSTQRIKGTKVSR